MAKGGKQPGAGRPKGSKTVPQFRDYVSDKARATFVAFVLSKYQGDMRLTTWMGDQLFGKAPQPITGPGGKDLYQPTDDATRALVNAALSKYLGNK